MKRLLARQKVANLLGRTFGPAPFLKQFEEFKHDRKIESVHFICTGNICRSPYAEHFAKGRLSLAVRSSGLFTTAGRTADASAIRIAAEREIDLSVHRTSLFDPKDIASNELLVVMEKEHLLEIASRSPELVSQTVLLGAFTVEDRFPLVVADPWGQDDGVFRKCFDQIELGIEKLGVRLNG